MKVVVLGDTHIGAIFGLGEPRQEISNTRIEDYKKSWEQVATYCIENKVDAFIQTGDVFETRNPSQEQIDIVDEIIRSLASHHISVFILMGNHDYRRIGTTFTSAISSLTSKELPNVRMLLEPECITIQKNDEKINLLLFPYRDRRMYDGKDAQEDSFAYEKEIFEYAKQCETAPTLFVGHNFFYKDSYSDFAGMEILVRRKIFKQVADCAIMGHHHDYEAFPDNVIYIGSMDRKNFADANVRKYFIAFDSAILTVSKEEIHVRPLYEMHFDATMYDAENATKAFSAYCKEQTETLSNAIVRIYFKIKDSIAPHIKKQEIVKSVYEQQAFYVSKILFELESSRILGDKIDVSNKTDIDLISEYVDKSEFTSDEKIQIMKELAKIIK